VHTGSLAGTIVVRRGTVATSPAPVVRIPTHASPATHQPAPTASAVLKAPAQNAKTKLADLRDQVLAAVQQAQGIAAAGTTGAIELATTTLNSSLAALGTTIDKVLASFGLKLPETAASPATPTTTAAAPSLPAIVLAPVQQVLSGVDALLSQLLHRRAG
jgi:hypothetical protein